MAMIDKGADPAISVASSSKFGNQERGSEGDSGVPDGRTIDVATVARKLLSNRHQVEEIKAAQRRREPEKQTYLTPFISWFQSGKQWLYTRGDSLV